jgi:hypothetical protein
MRQEGDVIRLSDNDRDRAKRNQPIDHRPYWDKALDTAVKKVKSDKGPLEVHRYVLLQHGSPGGVDGYWVALDTPS